MKLFPALMIALLATASVHAGSFGGPTSLQGSLDTTASGMYQATARGNGISGVIRFSYTSNGNPSTTGTNAFTFFVNGAIVTGTADAAIMGNKIAGMLTSPTVATVPPTLGGFTSTGGSFQAKLNTSSAAYFFKGTGQLQTYVTASAPAGAALPDPVSQVYNFQVAGQRTSTALN